MTKCSCKSLKSQTMSMALTKAKPHVKISASWQRITDGAWQIKPLMSDSVPCAVSQDVFDAKLYTTGSIHEGTGWQTEDGCVWDGCCQPSGELTPHQGGQSDKKTSMGVSLASDLGRFLPCVWSQYSCHFVKICWQRAVFKSKLRTSGTRVPWIVATQAVASATLLQLILTWPNTHF